MIRDDGNRENRNLIIINVHLIAGIQQENRHIRQLQHENKELRAALEEHQNVLELIMSKYRQHMSCLVHSTKIEKDMLIQENSKVNTINWVFDQVLMSL